ncbi:hypothetical protein DOE51_09475 [Bdellovibrio sp. NC01]|nr:hypothetical protein DOE51_09475 [Bdellovibrio sp. NC01]
MMCLAAFCSGKAFAGAKIDSEFELVLPKTFQQNLIEQKWKSLASQKFSANWQFPDQIVETSQSGNTIQVHLDGIKLALATQLKKPALQNGQSQTLLELTSSDLQAQMTIGKISVNQTVEQTVGGITGRFDLKAECNNVVLNMKAGAGTFAISLKPAVASSQVAAQVNDVALSWQPDAWVAQSFSCTGAEGFADLVNQQLQKISADSASFVDPRKELIVSYVKDYLGKFSIDLATARELVSSRSDVKTSMTIDSFDDSQADKMIAKGHVTVEFTRIDSTDVTSLALSTKDANYTLGSSALIRLPGTFAKEVMAKAYAANTWVHRLTSAQLPGFSSLMNSRFSQFFVWPELMNYSKSAKFLFDVYSNKDPKITGSGLQYQVNLNLLTKMQAPNNGNYVPFMNFTIPFASKVTMSVANSALKATFANTDMTLKYQWDSSYVNKFGPSQRFGASTIQGRILDAIDGQSTTVTLPAIPLTTGLSLKVNKAATLSNSDLLLQLAP